MSVTFCVIKQIGRKGRGEKKTMWDRRGRLKEKEREREREREREKNHCL